MKRPAATALLGVLLAAAIGVWWVFSGDERKTPRAAPHDDLDLVLALIDAGGGETEHDLLVPAPGGLLLARASDRTLARVSTKDGTASPLAHLDTAARGIASAGNTVWITTRHALQAVPLSGGEPRRIAELSRPGRVVADAQRVCVVDVDPTTPGLTVASVLVCVSPDGSNRHVIGRSGGEIAGLALDGGTLYWVDRLEGNIVAEDAGDGGSHALATDRGLPGELVVSGDTLYWVEKRSESLWRMPRTGGTPTRVTQDFAGFANLLVDARGPFWTNEAAVDGAFRVVTVNAGGESSSVSGDVDGVDALASSDGVLWWSRGGVVSRVLSAGDR